jgi:chromosome segregation ATPase
MDWQYIVAILGAMGGAGGVFSTIEGVRKNKRIPIDQGTAIANSAVKLIEKLQLQADSLQKQLVSANTRADDLGTKLRSANKRADDLQEKHDDLLIQLSDAQSEVRIMRVTIKSLSTELDKHNGPNQWRSQ